MKKILFIILSLACTGKSLQVTSEAGPPREMCDIDCVTGGLDGWYTVPNSCDQDAQANPAAPDWYMNCNGMTYTPYDGGAWSCSIPTGICQ